MTFIRYLLAISLLCAPLSAYAKQDEEARRAILALRSQLKHSDMLRDTLWQHVQSLQNELRTLRAQIEEMHFHQQRQQMHARENDAIGVSPQVGDPKEQQDYDNALDFFRSGQYQNAAKDLSVFVTQYPHSLLIPSALFYEGSSRYATKDYAGAIATLERLVAHYPNVEQAPEALLVIAGSLLELNQLPQSKETLQLLLSRYPNTAAAETAKERLQLY